MKDNVQKVVKFNVHFSKKKKCHPFLNDAGWTRMDHCKLSENVFLKNNVSYRTTTMFRVFRAHIVSMFIIITWYEQCCVYFEARTFKISRLNKVQPKRPLKLMLAC